MRPGIKRNILLGILSLCGIGVAFILSHTEILRTRHPLTVYVLQAPSVAPQAFVQTSTTPALPVEATDVVAAAPQATEDPSTPEEVHYIEIINSCGPDWSGGCVNARERPTASSTSLLLMRTGMVLAVASTTYTDESGATWYQIAFNEWLRYPERLKHTLYVSAEYTKPFANLLEEKNASTTKEIIINRSTQKLFAYDGDDLFMEAPVSTGLDLTPTPRGIFTIYKKTPTRYMQGPLPGISTQKYDLPGVPWDLYFTPEGGAIHGAYWHNQFGKEWSHGCVNLPIDLAQKLYEWAPLGTKVVVKD